jgi:hypothetical protein
MGSVVGSIQGSGVAPAWCGELVMIRGQGCFLPWTASDEVPSSRVRYFLPCLRVLLIFCACQSVGVLQMLDALRSDAKACRQFLLLVHLYSRTDVSALAKLRRQLVKPTFNAAQVWMSSGVWIA